MDDLIMRLRDTKFVPWGNYQDAVDAASAIERLTARVAELEAQLTALRNQEPVYQFRPDCENWIDCTPEYFSIWSGEKRLLYTQAPPAEPK